MTAQKKAAKPKRRAASSKPPARRYSPKTIKLLFGFSAARCSKCRRDVVAEATAKDPAVVLGKIAHIVGHSDIGPRAEPTFAKGLRNQYPNLLLLCGLCHDLVDAQDSTFTCGQLRKLKKEHESWVRDKLAQAMPQIGFAELEVLSKGLLNAPSKPVTTFKVTDPAKKMKRNGLTSEVRHSLTMGLAKAREVEGFVSHMAAIDDSYPERLKAGFVANYENFRKKRLRGDSLFEALVQFAAGGSSDFKRTATSLAILAYLFEKCEVFER
ncbi:MAG: hypothetical protein JNK25_03500 [Phycisphaerae bacterium]|nr:hypothetical protein [Phycisphaerae bacterium]